jgi:copper chaperone CopZ
VFSPALPQVVTDASVVTDAAVVAAVEDCGFDGALLSAADEAAPKAAAVTLAVRPLARAALEIHGMHCASCTGACERALRDAPGVALVAVSLLPPRADVSYDADATGPRALIAVIEAAGFEARLADRARPSADGAHCAACVRAAVCVRADAACVAAAQRTRRRRAAGAPPSCPRCC